MNLLSQLSIQAYFKNPAAANRGWVVARSCSLEAGASMNTNSIIYPIYTSMVNMMDETNVGLCMT